MWEALGMRFVVLGAGAVGGVVGGRLFEHGHDVLLIARGEHARAISSTGLTLASASGVAVLPVPVTVSPFDVDWRDDDVVLMAVKSQDTEMALRQLSGSAPASVPVVCMQNGVANEAAALRRFANVYGVCVMCPASHLEPGVVVASSSPISALLDIGRYPSGTDEVAAAIAGALGTSTIESLVRADIMRWKYTKLLRNLGNAIDAICGPGQRGTRLAKMASDEGEATLLAAGIAFASEEEDRARRDNLLRPGDDVSGYPRGGSSSWQSLARYEGTIEADYLNGEIVLLGRTYGVPTPVNELLRRVANQMASERIAPGSMTADEVLALLEP
jgi:2-dehydropantoate 2-reductase